MTQTDSSEQRMPLYSDAPGQPQSCALNWDRLSAMIFLILV